MASEVAEESGSTLTQSIFQVAVRDRTMGIGPSSSFTELVAHPSFRRIVEFGRPAVPYLLREIQHEPSLLVWAMHEITGENPVPRSARGKIREMSAAWVSWGNEHESTATTIAVQPNDDPLL